MDAKNRFELGKEPWIIHQQKIITIECYKLDNGTNPHTQIKAQNIFENFQLKWEGNLEKLSQ